MKIGTMLRIPDISAAEGCFASLAAMGIPSSQLIYKPETYLKEDAAKLVGLSEKYGVELSAQFAGFRPGAPSDRYSQMEYWKRAAEFITWLGLDDMVIHAGTIPEDRNSFAYSVMLERIRVIALHCKSLELNLLFETGIELPIALLRLIEKDAATGNLYVNLDTANGIMSGSGNPVDALWVLGKYVRNVHAKDGMPPSAEKNGGETPIGEGWVDFPRFIGLLKELGYDRYITIEREISGEAQKKDILAAKGYIEKLWNGEGN